VKAGQEEKKKYKHEKKSRGQVYQDKRSREYVSRKSSVKDIQRKWKTTALIYNSRTGEWL
jgi:hypothetical protein